MTHPSLTGSERIVKKTGQAVFYGDVSRVRRGYYQCDFKLITTEPAKYKDWEITDKYFQLLEETIRRQPELYLWSHKDGSVRAKSLTYAMTRRLEE